MKRHGALPGLVRDIRHSFPRPDRARLAPCGSAERGPAGPVRELRGAAATTTPFPELHRRLRPQLVVVVMGDTLGACRQPSLSRAWIWQEVTGLTKAIRASGTKCFWVGPPWGQEGGKFGKSFERIAELSAYLADIVAPCTHVDSLRLSDRGGWGTIDGQHLTDEDYEARGKAIGAAIAAPGALPAPKR